MSINAIFIFLCCSGAIPIEGSANDATDHGVIPYSREVEKRVVMCKENYNATPLLSPASVRGSEKAVLIGGERLLLKCGAVS